jgi:hypothetical protein
LVHADLGKLIEAKKTEEHHQRQKPCTRRRKMLRQGLQVGKRKCIASPCCRIV